MFGHHGLMLSLITTAAVRVSDCSKICLFPPKMSQTEPVVWTARPSREVAGKVKGHVCLLFVKQKRLDLDPV